MEKKFIILYYSKSNNTKLLAKRIFEIARHYLLEKHVSIEYMKAEEMDYGALMDADALIIGSPDYFSYPSGYIKIFFDYMYDHKKAMREKPAFTFLTHGGGGKAAKYLDNLAESIDLDLVSKCVSVEEKDIDKKAEKKIIKALSSLADELNIEATF